MTICAADVTLCKYYILALNYGEINLKSYKITYLCDKTDLLSAKHDAILITVKISVRIFNEIRKMQRKPRS